MSEPEKCPSCGLTVGHLGDCLLFGHQEDNQEPLGPEIQKMVDDNFWKLVGVEQIADTQKLLSDMVVVRREDLENIISAGKFGYSKSPWPEEHQSISRLKSALERSKP